MGRKFKLSKLSVPTHGYQCGKGKQRKHLCPGAKKAKKRFNGLLAIIGAPPLKLSAKPNKQRSPRIWHPMENYTRPAI